MILSIYLLIGFVFTCLNVSKTEKMSLRTTIDALTSILALLITFLLWPYVWYLAIRLVRKENEPDKQ